MDVDEPDDNEPSIYDVITLENYDSFDENGKKFSIIDVFIWSCKIGNREIFDEYYKRCKKDWDITKAMLWDFGIVMACEYGHLDLVKILFPETKDVEVVNPRTMETIKGNNFCIRKASRGGHIDIVKFLIANGADYTYNGNECFRHACKDYNQDILDNFITNN